MRPRPRRGKAAIAAIRSSRQRSVGAPFRRFSAPGWHHTTAPAYSRPTLNETAST